MNIPGNAAAAAARRFVARTGREALRLVREALGEDAVLVSNRLTAAGVEIHAVPALKVHAPAPQPLPLPPAPPPVTLALEPSPVAPAAASGDAVLHELISMRAMIEEQLAGRAWTGEQRRDPLRGHLLRLLLGAGFSARLARATVDALPAGLPPAAGLAWVKAEVARQLPAIEGDDALLDAGGVYALVGPTGVGKTTTTAKLAARCVMRFGPEKLALVTTDSFRIGAYEQLRIYGQILGVPVHCVKDPADLRLVLDDLRDKHMVLVDTVGMSQRDRKVAEQLAMLRGADRPVKRLLLLNATSHGDTLDEVVQAYRRDGDGLAGCILTKMDEATHPGAAMDVAIRNGLPVHYVSAGQKVPEHLGLPQPAALVDAVFGASSRTALFVPGEADVQQQVASLRTEADVALAQAEALRLQEQCRRLVRALADDACEIAAQAEALSSANIGFAQVQALWRELSSGAEPEQTPFSDLPAAGCDRHVLAICGKGESGASALLLSDRNGDPLAAAPCTGLAARDFGHPVVLLLDAPPREPAHGAWVARAPARLAVFAEDGAPARLPKVAEALAFEPGQPMTWRGRTARRAVAQARVALAANGPLVRLVVQRITDADDGTVLAQRYLLASADIAAEPEQFVQWLDWRTAVLPAFRLLQDAHGQLASAGLADAALAASPRVAQAVTTAWRLHRSREAWAQPVRALLARLAGHRLRSDRAIPAPVLFEGLGKFCVLLEALADGEAVLPATAAETAPCA